jgi:hypothetical protein
MNFTCVAFLVVVNQRRMNCLWASKFASLRLVLTSPSPHRRIVAPPRARDDRSNTTMAMQARKTATTVRARSETGAASARDEAPDNRCVVECRSVARRVALPMPCSSCTDVMCEQWRRSRSLVPSSGRSLVPRFSLFDWFSVRSSAPLLAVSSASGCESHSLRQVSSIQDVRR